MGTVLRLVTDEIGIFAHLVGAWRWVQEFVDGFVHYERMDVRYISEDYSGVGLRFKFVCAGTLGGANLDNFLLWFDDLLIDLNGGWFESTIGPEGFKGKSGAKLYFCIFDRERLIKEGALEYVIDKVNLLVEAE